MRLGRREFVRTFALTGGYLLLTRDASARAHAGGAPASKRNPAGAASTAGRNYSYQLNYICSYGQSLSLGAWGAPVLSTEQRFDSLMFAGGPLPQAYSSNLSSDYGSALPLVENGDTTNFNGTFYGIREPGETILSGLTEAVKELMESEDNASPQNFPDYRLLGSCPGHGSYSISSLSQGTAPYELLLYEVNAAKAIANQLGLTFGVPLVTWMQGEADICCTAADQYNAYLTQLIQQQLNPDIKAATGQSQDILFLMYQTAEVGGFGIACAQYNVSKTVAQAQIATPTYPFATSNYPHLTAESYKVHGAYFGAAFKKIYINGEKWLPLCPQSVSYAGNQITLTLNVPYGPVVADLTTVTSTNPAKAAYGFSLLDASSNVVDIDGKVSINGDNQIMIASPEAIEPGFTLQYGNTVNGTGGGNIRDSQGDTYIFNGGGLNWPMNNWLVVFSYVFPGATTTSITANASSVVAGKQITLIARVISAQISTVPTGEVSFRSDGQVLGTAVVNSSGVAELVYTANVRPGTYTVVAEYLGDSTHLASQSAGITGNVQAITATVLSASSLRIASGAYASLTAVVTPAGSSIAPSGTVSFYGDGVLIGNAPVSQGKAVLAGRAEFANGTYSLQAVYSGDQFNVSSTSAALSITIE